MKSLKKDRDRMIEIFLGCMKCEHEAGLRD